MSIYSYQTLKTLIINNDNILNFITQLDQYNNNNDFKINLLLIFFQIKLDNNNVIDDTYLYSIILNTIFCKDETIQNIFNNILNITDYHDTNEDIVFIDTKKKIFNLINVIDFLLQHKIFHYINYIINYTVKKEYIQFVVKYKNVYNRYVNDYLASNNNNDTLRICIYLYIKKDSARYTDLVNIISDEMLIYNIRTFLKQQVHDEKGIELIIIYIYIKYMNNTNGNISKLVAINEQLGYNLLYSKLGVAFCKHMNRNEMYIMLNYFKEHTLQKFRFLQSNSYTEFINVYNSRWLDYLHLSSSSSSNVNIIKQFHEIFSVLQPDIMASYRYSRQLYKKDPYTQKFLLYLLHDMIYEMDSTISISNIYNTSKIYRTNYNVFNMLNLINEMFLKAPRVSDYSNLDIQNNSNIDMLFFELCIESNNISKQFIIPNLYTNMKTESDNIELNKRIIISKYNLFPYTKIGNNNNNTPLKLPIDKNINYFSSLDLLLTTTTTNNDIIIIPSRKSLIYNLFNNSIIIINDNNNNVLNIPFPNIYKLNELRPPVVVPQILGELIEVLPVKQFLNAPLNNQYYLSSDTIYKLCYLLANESFNVFGINKPEHVHLFYAYPVQERVLNDFLNLSTSIPDQLIYIKYHPGVYFIPLTNDNISHWHVIFIDSKNKNIGIFDSLTQGKVLNNLDIDQIMMKLKLFLYTPIISSSDMYNYNQLYDIVQVSEGVNCGLYAFEFIFQYSSYFIKHYNDQEPFTIPQFKRDKIKNGQIYINNNGVDGPYFGPIIQQAIQIQEKNPKKVLCNMRNPMESFITKRRCFIYELMKLLNVNTSEIIIDEKNDTDDIINIKTNLNLIIATFKSTMISNNNINDNPQMIINTKDADELFLSKITISYLNSVYLLEDYTKVLQVYRELLIICVYVYGMPEYITHDGFKKILTFCKQYYASNNNNNNNNNSRLKETLDFITYYGSLYSIDNYNTIFPFNPLAMPYHDNDIKSNNNNNNNNKTITKLQNNFYQMIYIQSSKTLDYINKIIENNIDIIITREHNYIFIPYINNDNKHLIQSIPTNKHTICIVIYSSNIYKEFLENKQTSEYKYLYVDNSYEISNYQYLQPFTFKEIGHFKFNLNTFNNFKDLNKNGIRKLFNTTDFIVHKSFIDQENKIRLVKKKRILSTLQFNNKSNINNNNKVFTIYYYQDISLPDLYNNTNSDSGNKKDLLWINKFITLKRCKNLITNYNYTIKVKRIYSDKELPQVKLNNPEYYKDKIVLIFLNSNNDNNWNDIYNSKIKNNFNTTPDIYKILILCRLNNDDRDEENVEKMKITMPVVWLDLIKKHAIGYQTTMEYRSDETDNYHLYINKLCFTQCGQLVEQIAGVVNVS